MTLKVALDNFSAQLDTRPGAEDTLTVKGSVETPTSGWGIALSEKGQPGVDPTILKLSLSCSRPHGNVSPAITMERAVFTKKNASRYVGVILSYGDDTMALEVTKVS